MTIPAAIPPRTGGGQSVLANGCHGRWPFATPPAGEWPWRPRPDKPGCARTVHQDSSGSPGLTRAWAHVPTVRSARSHVGRRVCLSASRAKVPGGG